MFLRSRSRPVPAVLAAALATALTLAAGCGNATSEASTAGSSSDAGSVTAYVERAPDPSATDVPVSPGTTRPAPPPRPTEPAAGLPWPSTTVAELQKAVDGGSQPWLLVPTEVARSYGVSRGWQDVQVRGIDTAGSTVVTVHSSAGTHMLTVAQPGRRGQGGIWLVTADSTG